MSGLHRYNLFLLSVYELEGRYTSMSMVFESSAWSYGLQVGLVFALLQEGAQRI